MKTFDVFYQKPDFFRDGIMGTGWLKQKNRMPKATALSETHVFLRQVEAENLELLYEQMQAEKWSPNGEARELIRSRGLQHTSMSVGDIAVDVDGKVWIVDNFGFAALN